MSGSATADNTLTIEITVNTEVMITTLESLSNHYEYDSDYGWRPIEPSAHAPVVIPLSLSDSTSVPVR